MVFEKNFHESQKELKKVQDQLSVLQIECEDKGVQISNLINQSKLAEEQSAQQKSDISKLNKELIEVIHQRSEQQNIILE